MSEVTSAQPARYAGWLPEALLGLGVVCVAANWVLLAPDPLGRGDPFLAVGDVVALGFASYIRMRRPDLPISLWITLAPIGTTSLGETVLNQLLLGNGSALAIGWIAFAGTMAATLGIVAMVYWLGLYPEGRLETRRQRIVTGAAWLLLVVPVVVALGSPSVPLEYYIQVDPIPNPLHVLPWSVTPGIAAGASSLTLVALAAALALAIGRYRRGDARLRRRMRWLLLPVTMLVIATGTAVVFQERSQLFTWIALIALIWTMPLVLAVGILEPAWLDVDKILRRMLVYGVLWLTIAAAYVGLAALVGVTASDFLPVEWAVVVALLAAMCFQPARVRLEALADRWVFGRRTDPGQVIARLGNTLATTFDLDALLPRMAAAVEEGLGVEWARVQLAEDEAEGDPAALSTPVMLDGSQIGIVACGPKRSGAFTAEDRQVLETFARQASLAVGNVRLTERLGEHAAELAASRTRLVRAQESERRRIERNIHDGVQQDLVALIGLAGQARGDEDLDQVRRGLTRVLGDVRDLARGIHPSLLSDRGLLPAVEALSVRHPVPVDLRADATIRDLALPAEIEGACYFTIAEALANSAKYADATSVAVMLTRRNGSLEIRVSDDGNGFDPNSCNGAGGIPGLRDRLAALGGTLLVESSSDEGTVITACVGTGAGNET